MKKLYKKIMHIFNSKKLELKISKLEKEIEEVKVLTTNNYWKLKKELKSTNKKTKQK